MATPILLTNNGALKWIEHEHAGATFCFLRELWRRQPFRRVSFGDDQAFLKDHQAERIEVPKEELFIVVRHQVGNSWDRFGKNSSDFEAGDDLSKLFVSLPDYRMPLRDCIPAQDFEFYEGLRTG